MCRYQRAPECSTAMHSSRMCRACHLHGCKLRSRMERQRKAVMPGEGTVTWAKIVARHAESWACRSWL